MVVFQLAKQKYYRVGNQQWRHQPEHHAFKYPSYASWIEAAQMITSKHEDFSGQTQGSKHGT